MPFLLGRDPCDTCTFVCMRGRLGAFMHVCASVVVCPFTKYLTKYLAIKSNISPINFNFGGSLP